MVVSRDLQFVESTLSIPCSANIYDWYNKGWPHNATVPLRSGSYLANETEFTTYYTKGVVVKPPMSVDDGKLVLRRKVDSKLAYSLPQSKLTLDYHGGGGDIVGYANATLEWYFPEDWQNYLGGEGVVVTLEVANTLNDEPGKRVSYFQGGDFSLTVDWNSVLDAVVLIATRKIFSNLNTQVLVQTVYGKVKPTVNLKTHIELSYRWATNDHESYWNDWKSTISLNALWEGSKTLIGRASASESESSFELVSSLSADAYSSDDE